MRFSRYWLLLSGHLGEITRSELYTMRRTNLINLPERHEDMGQIQRKAMMGIAGR